MAHYTHLELFLCCLNGEGSPQVLKIRFLHNLPVVFALLLVFPYDELQANDAPLRSFIQHDEGTSFWRRSHAHTFCCSNLGS